MDKEKLSKLAEIVAKQLELTNDISKKFVEEALLAVKTFDAKHTEKGLSKLDKFGPTGILVKADEKYESLLAIYDPRNDDKEEKEKILKLWEDLAVYALMGKIIENDDWK